MTVALLVLPGLSNDCLEMRQASSPAKLTIWFLLALTLWTRSPATPGEALAWLGHDRTRPKPTVVDPGRESTNEKAGRAPSDAIVLFEGGSIAAWTAMDGQPTKWIVRDGAMECVPGSGYARTLQSFGACQLHVEFATPVPASGRGQGRGNSGVFFGMGRFEVQVLDSYENSTYADGSCGAVYNQFPPLVNASRPPGQWQSYDMLWIPPEFESDGKLRSAPRLTVFQNGVLIQDHVELIGETGWLDRSTFTRIPRKMPLALQDHGNPVRYRNIWVRELQPGRPEFYLPEALLDSYCGKYQNCEVSRGENGSLRLFFQQHTFDLFAESTTHFFAKTIDIQANFDPVRHAIQLSIGEDGGEWKQKQLP